MQKPFNEFSAENNVAIPILQRDYVQGADKNADKRNKFVKQLLEALLSGNVSEIDFIFGSSDTDRLSRPYFIPVDGQQRLTTLWLLGWILNRKCGGRYADKLPVLTYTSRPSTEQFCKELHHFTLPCACKKISEHIRKEPGWFSYSWLSDPSINAMLEMLDYIDAALEEDAYPSSVELMAERFFEQSPIRFELLDMKSLSLNDDLYIKMNARGKLLTPFENWKAEFEGFLAKRFPEDIYHYGEIPTAGYMGDMGDVGDVGDVGNSGNSGKVPINEYFEYAIEHEWCYMLWPMALERWEKDKETYPRIDEQFMNLIDFISRFLYYSQCTITEPDKDDTALYEHDIDTKRIATYESQQNTELLFRILDTLVKLRNRRGSFSQFMEQIFVTNESSLMPEPADACKVNLYDAPSVDLVTLCLDGKMDYFREITLWAVMKWLIAHPECMEKEASLTSLTDYVRIMVGWARGRNQRATSGLNVNMNLRVTHYKEANTIIDRLLSKPSLQDGLAATDAPSMEDERRKGRLYGTPKFDIIRKLSPCRSLFYCFNLLLPAIEQLPETETDTFIRQFYDFMALPDAERIAALISHGFTGVDTELSHFHFFGRSKKWDYIFTLKASDNSFANTREALIGAITGKPGITGPIPELQYYMQTYPEFIQARDNVRRPDAKPTHYMKRNHWWEIWMVKTFSTNPLQGYNSEPFGFVVQERYSGKELQLWSESDYSEHGRLWIKPCASSRYHLSMECVADGWLLRCNDPACPAYQALLKRLAITQGADGSITAVTDTGEQFRFRGATLLDLAGQDRIQTALTFLHTLSNLL